MKFRRRKRRRVPGINTASIADISFTLLILFLVVTSMDDDKGLSRMLPPVTPEIQKPTEITERNVLQVEIDDNDSLKINGEMADISSLKDRIKVFVDNPQNDPNLPEKHEVDIHLLGKCMITESHIIQLKPHRNSSYETYFQVQNVIVDAYRELRDSMALIKFNRSYVQCNDEQREALRQYYPQKVSEDYTRKEDAK